MGPRAGGFESRGLSDIDHEIERLRVVHRLTFKEIAARIGKGATDVRKRLERIDNIRSVERVRR
jgi:DNA-binding Lrp family transcriptional regulator